MQAEIPQTNVDVLISESTFGTSIHENRTIREQQFQQEAHPWSNFLCNARRWSRACITTFQGRDLEQQ